MKIKLSASLVKLLRRPPLRGASPNDEEALRVVYAVLDQRLKERYRNAVKAAEQDPIGTWDTIAINNVLQHNDCWLLARRLRRGELGPKGREFAADFLEGRVKRKRDDGRPRNVARSEKYLAARELPEVEEVLRQHYGHVTHELAIKVTAKRNRINEDEFRAYLRSRYWRRESKKLTARITR